MISLVLCLLMALSCVSFAAAEDAAAPVMSFRDVDAATITREMGLGWNLGNTFDAVRDTAAPDEMSIERYWCGETTTEAMIEAVRDAGFSTVRIPVS
jgi:endoglucanase